MANAIDACSVSEHSKRTDEICETTTANISDGTLTSRTECNDLPKQVNGHSTEKSDINELPINHGSMNDESSMATSNQYKDFSGIDTESFITNTLRDHPKDRGLLLSLEKFFRQFIQDDQQTIHQFQAMNSYERMLVHRVAAFFGLSHNIDKNGQSVMVSKTATTRIPNISFESFIPANELSTSFIVDLNLPMENQMRRVPRRNERQSNQQIFIPNKPSLERSQAQQIDAYDRYNQSSNNRIQRRDRSSINPNLQQRDPTTFAQPLHMRNQQTLHSSANPLHYPPQQTVSSSSMQNYVPIASSGSTPYGQSIPLAPIFFQHTPNGPLQYIYPPPILPQAPVVHAERQYAPIYPTDFVSTVVDNNQQIYASSPYVHLYPTTIPSPYLPPSGTAFVSAAPPANMKSIQYATNQLAALNLQSSYDPSRYYPSANPMNYLGRSLVQSSNGYNRMGTNPQSRSTRISHLTDNKSMTSVEMERKSLVNKTNNNSEQMSIVGSVQRTD